MTALSSDGIRARLAELEKDIPAAAAEVEALVLQGPSVAQKYAVKQAFLELLQAERDRLKVMLPRVEQEELADECGRLEAAAKLAGQAFRTRRDAVADELRDRFGNATADRFDPSRAMFENIIEAEASVAAVAIEYQRAVNAASRARSRATRHWFDHFPAERMPAR